MEKDRKNRQVWLRLEDTYEDVKCEYYDCSEYVD